MYNYFPPGFSSLFYERNFFKDTNFLATLYLNDMPVYFRCFNDDDTLENYEEGAEKCFLCTSFEKVREAVMNYPFYPIDTRIDIMFNKAAFIKKYKSEKYLVDTIECSDRLRAVGDPQNTHEIIAIRRVVNADETQIGFSIAYFLQNFKIQIRNENNAFCRNKFVIRSFAPITSDSDFLVPQGLHVSDDHIYQDSKNGFVVLLKDLIMRLMTITDVPVHTECTKENRYSIQPTPSYLVDPFQEELA